MELMNAVELKKHLHDQIEHLNEKSLEAMYSILEDYLGNSKSFELSEEHKHLIDERLEDYEKNPKDVITWEQSKEKIRKHL